MQAYAISDRGVVLDTTTVTAQGPFYQRAVDWNVPLVFRQFTVMFTGTSGDCTRLGNLYLKYQVLGYKLQESS